MKIGIVSSAEEVCANAIHAERLCRSLNRHFDAKVLNLRTAELLLKPGTESIAQSDRHIEQLCDRLDDFDLIDLHFEFGLYGHTVEQSYRRLSKICNHARRLVVTICSLSTAGDDFEEATRRLFNSVRARPGSRPYHFLTYSSRDSRRLEGVYGVPAGNITSIAPAFLSQDERSHLLQGKSPEKWKKECGFEQTDIVIGRFGFYASYKDYVTGLKALAILPDRYKMVFVGGQHPHSYKSLKIDPVVQAIVESIEGQDDVIRARPSYVMGETPLLSDRIKFLGPLEDEAFYRAMTSVDYVLALRFETEQSASGIIENALQLAKPVIVTRTSAITELQTHWPDCFETIDAGNHFELRDRILSFDSSRLERLEQRAASRSLDDFGPAYQEIFNGLMTRERAADADGCPEPTVPSPDATVPRMTNEQLLKELAHARQAFTDAVAVQELLKTEKFAAEKAHTEALSVQEVIKAEKLVAEQALAESRREIERLRKSTN